MSNIVIGIITVYMFLSLQFILLVGMFGSDKTVSTKTITTNPEQVGILNEAETDYIKASTYLKNKNEESKDSLYKVNNKTTCQFRTSAENHGFWPTVAQIKHGTSFRLVKEKRVKKAGWFYLPIDNENYVIYTPDV